jgi:hypothetical protein
MRTEVAFVRLGHGMHYIWWKKNHLIMGFTIRYNIYFIKKVKKNVDDITSECTFDEPERKGTKWVFLPSCRRGSANHLPSIPRQEIILSTQWVELILPYFRRRLCCVVSMPPIHKRLSFASGRKLNHKNFIHSIRALSFPTFYYSFKSLSNKFYWLYIRMLILISNGVWHAAS